MVRGSGVIAAFIDLKAAYMKNEFIKSHCHQLTHLIGRIAVDLYGDLVSTDSRGDSFCWSGYYHGVMEAIVAKIGPDRLLDGANIICADLGEHPKYSFYHYNCVHGLSHGFMGIQENGCFALSICNSGRRCHSWTRTCR